MSESPFTLPILGEIDQHQIVRNGDRLYATRGLLSSMGGAALLMKELGRPAIVDIGDCLSPICFRCSDELIEPLRRILEDALQESGFDRDRSALVRINPTQFDLILLDEA